MSELPVVERVKAELEAVGRLMDKLQQVKPPGGYRGGDAVAAHVARHDQHTYTEAQRAVQYAYAKLIRVRDVNSEAEDEYRVTAADITFTDLKVLRRNSPILRKLISAEEGEEVQITPTRRVEVLEVRYLDRHVPLYGHEYDFLAMRDADQVVVQHLRSWLAQCEGNANNAALDVAAVDELEVAGVAPGANETTEGETDEAPQLGQVERENQLRDQFYWQPTATQEEAMRSDAVGLVVVLGVAGSGKTSVALGRMAMLHLTGDDPVRAPYSASNGLGVVLNESLVGYLKKAMSGQLFLQDMKVLSFSAIKHQLAEKRHLLGTGKSRLKVVAAKIELQVLFSQIRWLRAYTGPLTELIAAELKRLLGGLPEGWTLGETRALNELEQKQKAQGIEVPDEAARTEPWNPPETMAQAVGFSARRSLMTVWARLVEAIHHACSSVDAKTNPTALLRSVEKARNSFKADLQSAPGWSSAAQPARQALQKHVKTVYERAFQLGERYNALVTTPAFRDRALKAAGVPVGGDLQAALVAHWSGRVVNAYEVESLLLLAEQTSAAYPAQDSADAIATLVPSSKYTHLFIDEFQDFTEVRFELLLALRTKSQAPAFAVGDHCQRLNPMGLSREFPRPAQVIFLGENKRQTTHLAELASAFRTAVQGDDQPATPVKPGIRDEKPFVMTTTDKDLDAALVEAIQAAREERLSVAVIFADANRASEVHGRVKDELEHGDVQSRLSIDSDVSSLCDTSVVHFTLPLPVKGLEFDAVFVLDVNQYDLEDKVAADELYVALTRARRRLGLAWQAPLASPLAELIEPRAEFTEAPVL
ncbi:MAG: UvrD-helicase domain-containing protein [Deltaproteobacteria bacterium]|nr:UvrD-helicase domain-containing protein [Deltaproteobacteria bacterium]